MTDTMSKKKGEPKGEKKPRGPVLYVQLTDAEESALLAFIQSQPAEPDRSAVGRKALHDFLRQHGHWPPK